MKNQMLLCAITISLLSSCTPALYSGEKKPVRNYTLLKKLNARCCTSPCWPDGLYGNVCTEEKMKKVLLKKAAALHADAVIEVNCEKTDIRCNITCASPPGFYFSCTGKAVRLK